MTKTFLIRLPAFSSDNLKSKIQNLKWGGIVVLAVTFVMCGAAAQAQQTTKIPRIGYLSGTSPEAPSIEAFRRALRDLGYIEGKNLLFEYRDTGVTQDRIPGLIAELVQLKVDVLVVSTGAMIRAAKQATKTIPIVMVTTEDPVATGLIDSLARPGGNVTGLTLLTRELNGKRLELLKEVAPTISRVGVLLQDSPDAGIRFKEYEAAARVLKITLQSLEVRSQNPDFEGAFQEAAKRNASALIVARHALLIVNRKQIVDLAIKNRLPSMFERSDMVEAGGLVSYATNEAENFRRAAVYVDKILKGIKPADLPVEQPTKFEFVVNLKTAKQIGLTISPNVLARADKVIR
jgi:putative ABC transport system substrate-binding protein